MHRETNEVRMRCPSYAGGGAFNTKDVSEIDGGEGAGCLITPSTCIETQGGQGRVGGQKLHQHRMREIGLEEVEGWERDALKKVNGYGG